MSKYMCESFVLNVVGAEIEDREDIFSTSYTGSVDRIIGVAELDRTLVDNMKGELEFERTELLREGGDYKFSFATIGDIAKSAFEVILKSYGRNDKNLSEDFSMDIDSTTGKWPGVARIEKGRVYSHRRLKESELIELIREIERLAIENIGKRIVVEGKSANKQILDWDAINIIQFEGVSEYSRFYMASPVTEKDLCTFDYLTLNHSSDEKLLSLESVVEAYMHDLRALLHYEKMRVEDGFDFFIYSDLYEVNANCGGIGKISSLLGDVMGGARRKELGKEDVFNLLRMIYSRVNEGYLLKK